MDHVNVGDEIQAYDEDGKPLDGVVTALAAPKRKMEENYWNFSAEEQKDMYPVATIKFDNDTEQSISTRDFDPRDSEVEREFRTVADMASEKIQAKLAKASKFLDEAVELSEKYGVPFHSSVSFLSQSYYPTTLHDKFEDIDSGFVNDFTGSYSEYGDSGWEHSAVC